VKPEVGGDWVIPEAHRHEEYKLYRLEIYIYIYIYIYKDTTETKGRTGV
jgi:hypothetical protein